MSRVRNVRLAFDSTNYRRYEIDAAPGAVTVLREDVTDHPDVELMENVDFYNFEGTWTLSTWADN